MNVLLWRVGRNLNRAYRTCAAFGVNQLFLLECAGDLRGNLYSARGQVTLLRIDEWPDLSKAIALETWATQSVEAIEWDGIGLLVLGGESATLPRRIAARDTARIATPSGLCLTTEAALAVGLYEWSKCAHR